MYIKQPNRRRFLKTGMSLAGIAAGTGMNFPAGAQTLATADKSTLEWYEYGVRSEYVKSKRIGTNGMYGLDRHPPEVPRDYGLRTPLQDSYGSITPTSLHFIINHGVVSPNIDPKEHRLMIHGLVDRSLVFTMDELQRLPSVTRFHFIECAGNSVPSGAIFGPGLARTLPTATVQQTHGLTSNSEWTGVPLSLLLERAGLKKEGTWIVAEGAEESKHFKSIPMQKVLDDTLVVYAQNGEPLRPEQGFPLRLLTPGYEGINNVKWLRRIKVVDKPYMHMRESTKYPNLYADGKSSWFVFQMGPKSVITRPSGGQRLAGPGFYDITGLAWSGGGTVRRVEVSSDGGKAWTDAELVGTAYRKAHTRFRMPWKWNGSEAVLQSRCTDDAGEVQPTVAEIDSILGVKLSLDWFKERPGTIPHFAAIQPWKVMRNGEVQNAIFA